MFDKGDQVVCINDSWEPWVRDSYDQLPKKGNVYTIREVGIGRDGLGSISQGHSEPTFKVLLEELHNMNDGSEGQLEEIGFRSDRFAPLNHNEEEEAIEEFISMPEDSKQDRLLIDSGK